MSTFLAVCAAPSPGAPPTPCRDLYAIGFPLLGPLLALLIAVAVVGGAIWLARRRRQPLEQHRRAVAIGASVLALSAIVIAVWASTHEYYAGEIAGNCTPLSSKANGSCLSEARAWAAGAIAAGGVALGGVVLVVRGPRTPRR